MAAAEADTFVDPDRPWPGLVAFTEGASSFFCGRDVECDELFRRIRRENVTLLFGQSGLGKTSLLQAGLFPLLRRSGHLPVSLRLDYSAPIAPRRQVYLTLQQELARAQLGKCTPMREDQSLWEYFHQAEFLLEVRSGEPKVPVLIFDQFEEAFTIGLANDDARAKTQEFLVELADLIENRPSEELEAKFESVPGLVEQFIFDRRPYRIVISLREDYLAALESIRKRAPSLGRNRLRLTPLSGQQALEAVVKPGRDLISSDIAISIIRFVSQVRREDPFGEGPSHLMEMLEIEPSLLSLFCHELNQRRLSVGAERITHELVSGSSQTVLEEFYEAALADQPLALRTFVEEELITKSGFRESISLDRAQEYLRLNGIDSDALELLVQRRSGRETASFSC